jgi:hypothetical protein
MHTVRRYVQTVSSLHTVQQTEETRSSKLTTIVQQHEFALPSPPARSSDARSKNIHSCIAEFICSLFSRVGPLASLSPMAQLALTSLSPGLKLRASLSLLGKLKLVRALRLKLALVWAFWGNYADVIMRPRKQVSRTDLSKNNGGTSSCALRLKHERISVHEGLYVRILLHADFREVPGGKWSVSFD